MQHCRLRLKCDGTRAETRFRLSAKRTSPFKSAGASVQSTTGSQGVRISGSNGSNVGYTMFRGSVKGTGYPLLSPVSPSLRLPCVTMCHHISTGLYSCHTKGMYNCVHNGNYVKQDTIYTGFEEAVVVLNLKTSINLDGLQEEFCTLKTTLALYLNDESKQTLPVCLKWYKIQSAAEITPTF